MNYRLIRIVIGCLLLLNTEVAVAANKEIHLPKPALRGKISLEEAIFKRRSRRHFEKKDLDLGQISQLLWASQGITAIGSGVKFRAAPSAGALYPMEIYLLNKDGLFRYIPDGHKLQRSSDEDLRDSLANSAFGQSSVREAAVDIVICAVYRRVTGKYGQRGTKYVHIEAGHVAQNIHLQAVALGLASVPVGAFDDLLVKRNLSLPDGHEPIYIIPVGYPK